jgi:hypothetical protein
MILVVEDPEPEYGDVDADLDGGVQTAGLPVVEVAADARTQRSANSFTQLKTNFRDFYLQAKCAQSKKGKRA